MPERPTWFLLTRDIPGSVKVKDTPVVMASLVLDAGTGLVRATVAAATGPEARSQAIRKALAKPTRHALPGPPAEVVCPPGDAAVVVSELDGLLGVPVVREGVSLEAEDVFDSVIGRMCGREQPGTRPAPGDWAQLVAATRAYRRAEPWLDRGDDRPLDLIVRTDVSVRWVAVVLGQERFQRGFVVYPGTDLPASVRRRRHHEIETEATVPQGTLMLYLDPPAENPPEFAAKARRYGWPADDELSPAWVAGAADGGPADLDQAAARTLTVALRAVLAHDDNGEPPADGPTAGEVSLPGGVCARYRISEMA